jgi:hypothetical protein
MRTYGSEVSECNDVRFALVQEHVAIQIRENQALTCDLERIVNESVDEQQSHH